jgi:hypothetical protein
MTSDDGRSARHADVDVEVLQGGVANAGAVVRQGASVLRPSNPNTPAIHALLAHLRDVGFDGASEPIGVDPDGRERMVFIPGDVPIPPYPAWAQADDALASVARLIRRYHDAVAGFVPPPWATWSTEMSDPTPRPGPTVVCHNDVCLENVVFRDGVAIGLLDFDFASPGSHLHDLAQFARMCIPLDDPQAAAQLGWGPVDAAARLRLIADAYGLAPGRSAWLAVIDEGIRRGGQFVLRRVEAGDPNFIEMWDRLGGMARFDRRRAWFAQHRERFADALG